MRNYYLINNISKIRKVNNLKKKLTKHFKLFANSN